MTSSIAATTANLTVPDGSLYYEVRGSGPLVAFVGAPMDAGPFQGVAELLADEYTVLTLDPRGHGRSVLNDPDSDSTPELRADDLARLIAAVGAGPAAVFGSSGGAVTCLALAQTHSELVHTVIAHEPPLRELLADRESYRAQTDEMIAAHRAGDAEGAWRKFFAMTGMEIPEPMLTQMLAQMTGPDRSAAEIASDDFFYEHELHPTSGWQPDLEALKTAPARIVIGIGDASAGQFCDKTSRALGAGMGIEPILFPGGHGGFTEDVEAFAKRVREVLREN
ncbi:alpha/beta fold hydrolase [Nocardia sp. NPDC057668]|uniref:alpha/beta fold hydrolase n=1 Tax=Nocardia sp. NPDC057668 TaxID=3346202 RepID=UPI00366BBB7E